MNNPKQNWYKKSESIRAYHGTPHYFEAFTIDETQEGHNQEGPGVYFTNNTEDASLYSLKSEKGIGSRVLPVYLNFNDNRIVSIDKMGNYSDAEKMILWSFNLENKNELKDINQDIYYESSLCDWGEDPEKAFKDALNNILQYSTSAHDMFQNIWINFYKNDNQKYLKNMVRLGYDGVIVPKQDNVIHYVVYNPNIISNGI